MRTSILTLAWLITAGCDSVEQEVLKPAPGAEPGGTMVPVPGVSSKLDLLFVIDNSNSMESEQIRLNAKLDSLMQTLVALQSRLLDAHIGVISTDLGSGPYITTTSCNRIGGDAGDLQDAPQALDCTPPSEAYIHVENTNGVLTGNIANVDTPTEDGLGCQGLVDLSGRPIPAEGDVALDTCDIQAAFQCIAMLGTGGCGFEQPLEAARKALSCDDTCTNLDFVRDSAVLAIVFLGDEDDCSARRGDLYNTAQTSLESPLGPLTSYRCFEFGVTCNEPIDRTGNQTLTGCRSKTAADVEDPDDLYLHPIQDYYDFFSTLRPQGRVVVAGVTGPYGPSMEINTVQGPNGAPDLEPACTGPGMGDTAYPAVRLNELIRLFGENGVVLQDQDVNDNLGICTDDFSPVLSGLGTKVVERLSTCVPGPLVDEDDTPIGSWTDAWCVVEDVTSPGTEDEVRTPLPRCEVAEGSLAPGGDGACPTTVDDLVLAGTPCWLVCDTSAFGDAACADRWQLRVCRDASCSPGAADPEDATTSASCAVQ